MTAAGSPVGRCTVAKAAYWLLGNLVIVHVSGEETEGRFCLVEFQSPAGDWTPLHVHRNDSQTTYLLEGEVTFHLPGETRTLGPGECILQPAAVPQTEQVTSAGPARMLDINSPVGFDRFVAAAGDPAESLTLPHHRRRNPISRSSPRSPPTTG